MKKSLNWEADEIQLWVSVYVKPINPKNYRSAVSGKWKFAKFLPITVSSKILRSYWVLGLLGRKLIDDARNFKTWKNWYIENGQNWDFHFTFYVRLMLLFLLTIISMFSFVIKMYMIYNDWILLLEIAFKIILNCFTGLQEIKTEWEN